MIPCQKGWVNSPRRYRRGSLKKAPPVPLERQSEPFRFQVGASPLAPRRLRKFGSLIIGVGSTIIESPTCTAGHLKERFYLPRKVYHTKKRKTTLADSGPKLPGKKLAYAFMRRADLLFGKGALIQPVKAGDGHGPHPRRDLFSLIIIHDPGLPQS